jgi:hypothetical protein
VYRAHQASLERDVAIKLLHHSSADDEQAIARFRFEATAAAALNHPNIVQVLEIGREQGLTYIAMQLVRGRTLAEHLRERRFAGEEAVALMLGLCDAVGYAHRLGLLHLDLKPANVIIDERGDPLVADFGLARRMNAQGQVEAQEVSGTPGYMAPEQVLVKEFRLSVATDIYALGAILYEMLSGEPPHGRGATADVMQRALAGRIPPPRSLDASVAKDLDAICLKCLSLRPAERYAKVEELAEDLRRFANGLTVSVRMPTLRERVQRWYAREPRLAAALIALLLLAVTAGLVMTRLYERSEHERSGAEGLVRLLMRQTWPEARPILETRENVRWPLVDCGDAQIHCNGNLERSESLGMMLAPADRKRYIEAIATYVPKIAEWGNPRLSEQVANIVQNARFDLYRFRRARVAAATGTTDGLVFAFVMVPANGADVELSAGRTHDWLAAAAEKTDQPWQAQLLAANCDLPDPACTRAIERFRELDPDNAAAWLLGLPDAPSDEGDRLIRRAASAARLAHADAGVDAALAFAGRLTPMLDAESRVSPEVFASESAANVSWIALPVGYCTRSVAERDAPAVEADCLAIFRMVGPQMHPGLLDEIGATTGLMHLSRDPAERAQAWQRLRNVRWVYSADRQLPPKLSDADYALRVRTIRDHGHLEWTRMRVAKAGLPIEAPEAFVTAEPLPWPRHRRGE